MEIKMQITHKKHTNAKTRNEILNADRCQEGKKISVLEDEGTRGNCSHFLFAE
jgi:hypothetical protein